MSEGIAKAWSDYILDLMVELEIIRTTEVQELWKPTHGNCCTCQDCGRPHDECICEDNRIITTVQERLRKDWGVEE